MKETKLAVDHDSDGRAQLRAAAVARAKALRAQGLDIRKVCYRLCAEVEDVVLALGERAVGDDEGERGSVTGGDADDMLLARATDAFGRAQEREGVVPVMPSTYASYVDRSGDAIIVVLANTFGELARYRLGKQALVRVRSKDDLELRGTPLLRSEPRTWAQLDRELKKQGSSLAERVARMKGVAP
jgi:hypothetical protein